MLPKDAGALSSEVAALVVALWLVVVLSLSPTDSDTLSAKDVVLVEAFRSLAGPGDLSAEVLVLVVVFWLPLTDTGALSSEVVAHVSF